MDGSSGPETKVHRGTATKARLHCFVRLICLPLRSILRLRPSFFPERERSSFSGGAPDWWESARFQAFFVAWSWFRQAGVTSSRPPAGNADRWAASTQRNGLCLFLACLKKEKTK